MFEPGEKVWFAATSRIEAQETCPICFGKRKVILILGNDERVELDCDFCGKGFDGPKGLVTTYKRFPRAEEVTIRSVESKRKANGEEEVRYIVGVNSIAQPEDLFIDENSALEYARQKAAEVQALEEEDFIRRTKRGKDKNYAWKAGYHRREAKRHREQAERHERAVVVCKARSRT